MKLEPKEWLKKIRYKHWLAVLITLLIYAVWKAYVLQTPSPDDDNIPDKVKDAVLIIVYDNDGTTIFPGDEI